VIDTTIADNTGGINATNTTILNSTIVGNGEGFYESQGGPTPISMVTNSILDENGSEDTFGYVVANYSMFGTDTNTNLHTNSSTWPRQALTSARLPATAGPRKQFHSRPVVPPWERAATSHRLLTPSIRLPRPP
jgi:hypothetical protein